METKSSKRKKRNGGQKFRHHFVPFCLRGLLRLFCKIKYNAKIDTAWKKYKHEPYLILYNHQTLYDMLMVGVACKGRVYYVASDDLFMNGFASKLLDWFVAPVSFNKAGDDLRAIIRCVQLVKEGATIALAAEGNRTHSGHTGYIKPSVVKLAKKLNVPLVFCKFEGGFGVDPRWGNSFRKGSLHCYVSRIVPVDEYKAMSDGELYEMICKELYQDDTKCTQLFPSKKSAEYLERAIYVCPDCGFAEWKSEGEYAHCTKCGKTVKYNADLSIEGVDCEFPFKNMAEWYDYQEEFIKNTDLSEYIDKPMFEETVSVYELEDKKPHKLLYENVSMKLFGDRYETMLPNGETLIYPFDEVGGASCIGRKKFNIELNHKVYQFASGERFNAVKYVHAYHHARYVKKGIKDVEFLGL